MTANQQPMQATLVSRSTQLPNQNSIQLCLFNVDGTQAIVAQKASDLPMTGYTAHAAGNVATTDSVSVAIAKLEARIAALEA